MKVLYEWRKDYDPQISSPVFYRFTTYDDERYDRSYEIQNIYLEEKREGKNDWICVEEYNGFTTVLNILHLIENVIGKGIEGSPT